MYMNTQHLPSYVRQYFWGDNLSELNLEKNQKYIIEVILEKGNRDAIRWLFEKIDKKIISNLLPSLNLSKKSANFWQTYLS